MTVYVIDGDSKSFIEGVLKSDFDSHTHTASDVGLGTSSDIHAISNLRGTAISENDDLNNYTTAGSYYCPSSAIAASLSNTPYTGSSFRLEVVDTFGSGFLVQFLFATGAGANGLWMRVLHNNAWRTWRRTLNTVDDLPLAVENGGTGATSAAAALASLGAAAKFDLLWTNPSPTSNFADDTISVSGLNNYNCIVIFYSIGKGTASNRKSEMILKDNDTVYVNLEGTKAYLQNGANHFQTNQRTLKINFSTSQIESYYGYTMKNHTASPYVEIADSVEDVCIPLYIYGTNI